MCVDKKIKKPEVLGNGGAVIYETSEPKATFELGRAMGLKAVPGAVYCLEGDLGVGKTVFTQGFAAGLGIGGPV